MAGTVLGSRATARNKTKPPALLEFTFLWERGGKSGNKQALWHRVLPVKFEFVAALSSVYEV